MNHPIAAEYRIRERQEELRTLAQSNHAARLARSHAAVPSMDRWRRAVGRVLVRLGVTVGLPRERRRPAVEDALALFEGRTITEPARVRVC